MVVGLTETQRRPVFTLKRYIDAGRHLEDAFSHDKPALKRQLCMRRRMLQLAANGMHWACMSTTGAGARSDSAARMCISAHASYLPL